MEQYENEAVVLMDIFESQKSRGAMMRWKHPVRMSLRFSIT